ncbi:coronin [Rhodotorula toruloides]|uniref:Coronin n=1 Tax=Rhodotorula toruloides TaxID=5286 RepID=A0A511KAN1_RHOTO|nr:coronin [Rhodotorula toruloides]
MLSRSPFYSSLSSPFDDVFAGFDSELIAYRRRQLALARARQIEEEERRRYEEAVNYRTALIRQAYEDEARRRHTAHLVRKQRRREIERALQPATWHVVVEYREPAHSEASAAIRPVAASTTNPSTVKHAPAQPNGAAQQQTSAVASTEASTSAAVPTASSDLPVINNAWPVEDVKQTVPEATSTPSSPASARRDIIDLMNAIVTDFDKHLAAFFPTAPASAGLSTSNASKITSDAQLVDQNAKSGADQPQDDVRDAFTTLLKTVDAIMAEGDKVFSRVRDELNKRVEAKRTEQAGSALQAEDQVTAVTSRSTTPSAAPPATPSASSDTADAVGARVNEVIRQAQELGATVEKLELEEREVGNKQENNEVKDPAHKEEEVVA